MNYIKHNNKYITSNAKYKILVIEHLNTVFDTKKGFHRDHIVPISFCRKLGIIPMYVNSLNNLRYISPIDNVNKGALIREVDVPHLKSMCVEWGIKYPSIEMIEEHNKRVSRIPPNWIK